MILISGLIWDDWNKQHIKTHKVTIEEIEEVCYGKHKAIESYRGRIQLIGKTKNGRKLIIILSPEDRRLKKYENDMYYPITAFDETII